MSETATPEVLWAQRSSVSDASKNFVYLTISVPDVPKEGLQLDLKPSSLTFTGTSATLKRKYHVELEFYAEIDPEESKINHTSKNIEIKLQKKELKEEYWPRLLKDSKKLHFLKTDFDKWVDEDEQNEAPEEDFSQFGGMGGMPGMGGGGDFGGIDFSKLGGGAGMPDLGDLSAGAGEGDDDDSGDDDDDDDMPALEGDVKEGAKKD
ncbi:p23 chaperone protein wos2, variant 2 [Purpureocillium takamizusanense]|uniref:P23 chaperone protein wos2 n=1 Tax=Purpureocillium takamizusanense TaxID=2060973 RepID=A0A9Q8VCB7_9HYPO|nr:p23 chaperone protein wos2 [Purpureocillium takamizusanense]XP_047843333.1 p23 chaperone protein wos2, variant 2 [Purpureocillium takamizusanense]UNI19851.1 p23 chaperone protein wos2 [Purpureocillium takamizusanense]UNI19852.1 p23 chaperone protein wos2, variant 2 [Purpureocillium takamizusanense]